MEIKFGLGLMKIINTKDIGKLIKAVRKKQNLRQQDVALACGVGIRFISDLESGKETCQIGKALTIITMLGIDIELNNNKYKI